MAGLGFKDFQVGEVLTSSDVDGYLMQQTVMRFADSAARGSALGTASGTSVALAEGMVSYLDDTDAVDVYNGSVWKSVSKVTQLESVFTDTNQTITSQTFSDLTSITVTVTPTTDAHKFLLIYSGSLSPQNVTPTEFQFRRGGTAIAETQEYEATSGKDSMQTMVYLDAPATASSVTYTVAARMTPAGGSCIYKNGSLTVMEVAP